jgi:hypothetical protein
VRLGPYNPNDPCSKFPISVITDLVKGNSLSWCHLDSHLRDMVPRLPTCCAHSKQKAGSTQASDFKSDLHTPGWTKEAGRAWHL